MSKTKPTYLLGDELYGDDFSLQEIEEWFKDEEEAYANLGAKNKDSYQYSYHALNQLHGFNHLAKQTINNALGLGSAYGDEFLPIAESINKLTILDPSDAFAGLTNTQGISCSYKKPNISGDISFPDNYFDLITSLGVLHHVPNVSHVVNECYRCLAEDGIMLIREPIVSMGDWAHPRAGLTKRERGIPLDIFNQIVNDAGFTVKKQSLCFFPPLSKICGMLGISTYNNVLITRLDSLMCDLFKWNLRYHATRTAHKFRPSSIFYVLSKN